MYYAILDTVALVGIGLIGAGVYFYDWRASLVVVGTLLLALALAGARGRAKGG